MADWQRTLTCGDLRDTHLGQTVTLNGWVLITRNYPNQAFVDLRDRYGLTQVVFDDENKELFEAANKLGREVVISVTGVVRKRLPGAERPGIATGFVEVLGQSLTILNTCPPLPFMITEFPDEELANEDLRLQYRYLDLRRRSLQGVLALRHRINKSIRDYLDSRDFLELETPLLGKSTPEGARDYLVPSRLFHGEWYALPQSPQLYKQLLMVAGYDRYFQIARCLRDEDLRADRQPEFTQLDVEMSFVEQDDVLNLMEGLSAELIEKTHGVKVQLPLPRMSYKDAISRFGSDKPDTRFGLELNDVTELVKDATLPEFRDAVASKQRVVMIVAPDAANPKPADARREPFTRKGQDKLAAQFTGDKAKIFYTKIEAGKMSTGIAKALEPCADGLLKAFPVKDGDMLWIGVGPAIEEVMGSIRTALGTDVLKLYRNWWDEKAEHDEKEEAAAKKEKRAPKPFVMTAEHLKMLWVVDFPMFTWDDEEKRWAANHHPFTAPRDEDLDKLESDPGKVYAKAYDLVLNGYEVGGGSIRIHRQETQARVFKLLGMDLDDAKGRFGFLLDALQSGAPPHGGIALGLDRWCMILAGTTNIRDVIAFPKNQRGRDLMTGAPASVDTRQLKDLGIKPQ
ncbi:aspartate--tRNA ligase [soil metagenome]